MSNSYFQFKQFIIHQDKCAMKVTTDACLFGAWVADKINHEGSIITNCLDIGTGTGLLSLLIAQKDFHVIIDALEIDEAAAEQAKENVLASKWKDRITVIHADAKEYLFTKKYDLIISNPPFYENELKAGSNKKNIAHHNEGLLLQELLAIIKTNLKENGLFFLLLPYKRNEEIKKLLLTNEFEILQMTFVKQSVNHDYFRIMVKGKLIGSENVKTELNEISIWNESKQYTPQFVTLLKDYYLYL